MILRVSPLRVTKRFDAELSVADVAKLGMAQGC